MQLFYAPGIACPPHRLGEEESRHAVRVLRLKPGDTVHITDGAGDLFCCRLIDADPAGCTVEIVDVVRDFEPLPCRFTLAVAPTKNAERYEWLLEKATEVGVSRLLPIATERSERRTFRPARAEKVITAAMKQSLKAYRPLLAPLTPLREALAEPARGRRFIAHCAPARSAAGKVFLPEALPRGEEVTVYIGPEGDFTPAEIDAALAAGCEELTLGTQRLRTETAALAAAVMVSVANHKP